MGKVKEVETLGDALPKEIECVQELIAMYESVPYGNIAACMMKLEIKKAHKAMMEGDLVGMIQSYKELQTFSD